MDNWNRYCWQGRRKNQVEGNYRGCGWLILAALIAFIINFIIVLI